jgi:hypothetical protein
MWQGRRGSPGDAMSRMGSPGRRGKQSSGSREAIGRPASQVRQLGDLDGRHGGARL